MARKGKVISVQSEKGGVGKTFLALHMAIYVSEDKKKKTLYIPLDNQGNAAKRALSIKDGKSLNGMFFGTEYEIQHVNANLDSLCSDKSIHNLDRTDFKEAKNFAEELAKIKNDYDYVIIDTPPGLGARITAAVLASDYIVCPVECEISAVEGLLELRDSIKKLNRFNPKAKVNKVVINKYRHLKDQQHIADLLIKYFPAEVHDVKIKDLQPIKTAMSYGRACWHQAVNGNHRAAGKLVKSVISKIVEEVK